MSFIRDKIHYKMTSNDPTELKYVVYSFNLFSPYSIETLKLFLPKKFFLYKSNFKIAVVSLVSLTLNVKETVV